MSKRLSPERRAEIRGLLTSDVADDYDFVCALADAVGHIDAIESERDGLQVLLTNAQADLKASQLELHWAKVERGTAERELADTKAQLASASDRIAAAEHIASGA